jgi:hypothetical protein
MADKHNPEKTIQQEIRARLGSRSDVRIFRNNVGLSYVGTVVQKTIDFITLKNFRPIKFGLFVGSGDLIGWKSVTVTPDMVGHRVAVFLSIETKSQRGVKKANQENWRDQVLASGGLAGFARSVDEAEGIVK